MQDHLRRSQTLAETQTQIETETQKKQLPMWCRGIMGGCVNCGGCV